MALPVNTYTTSDAIGNREDLSDVIYDISPMETPFVSGIPRVSASAVSHEWQTDALAAAATNNAQLEGDDATADAATPTVRLNNQTQIFRKVISVSRTQRSIKTAGRADEYEYQLAKRGRELKRDIERTVLSTHSKTVTASTATARNLAAVETWLSSNKYHFAATSTTPGAGTAMVIGNAVTITTSTQLADPLDTVIASCWTNGGDPMVIMGGAQAKKKLSQLSGIATLYRDVAPRSQGQIINGADVYVSNFGEHTIVPNRFMNPGTILVLDMEYWALAEVDGIMEVPLAKTGDSDRSMIITELTLESRNQAASGKISDMVFA